MDPIFHIFRSTSDISSCRTLSIFDIIYFGSYSAGKSFLAVNNRSNALGCYHNHSDRIDRKIFNAFDALLVVF